MRSLLIMTTVIAMVGGCAAVSEMSGSGSGTASGSGSASGGTQLSSQCANPDFGVSSAARKVGTFLRATAAFTGAAARLEGSLRDTCASMGGELGMSGLSGDTRSTCNAVATRLDEEMRALRANGQVTVDIIAVPPRCEVSVDAYAECAAQCDVDVEPGQVDIQCEGGYIYGECSAECTGECNVGATASCEGSCEGTCQAGCTGTCQGECEGTCSATGADGQCNGRCDGTCHGTCSAGCQGRCEGSCWVDAQAECDAECRGGCSVDYEAPQCTGEIVPPRIDAECQASCDAEVNAHAECEPGEVEVAINASAGYDEARAERVRAAIEAGWGELQQVRRKLQYLRSTGRGLVDATGNLRGVGRELGVGAVACITEAASVIPEAVASVGVSVEVSVEVSASASASAN